MSASSRLCELYVDSTSDFLDAKLSVMESELEYIRCVRDGLSEARQTETISHDAFQREIQPFLQSFRSSSNVIQVVKRQRRLIVEDIDEETSSKRQTIECPCPLDQGLLERAYRDAIVFRVLDASAKQKAPKFGQSAFKKKVHDYYGVNEHCLPGFGWCHVLNTILPKKSVKAAHLFGVDDGVLGDPRNGKNILFVVRLGKLLTCT
jgi:hypothetical protein